MMRSLLVYIVILASFLSREPNYVQKAMEAYESEELEEALSLLLEARKNYTYASDKIHYNIGQVYFQMDSLEKAKQSFTEVLSSGDSILISMSYNQIGLVEVQFNQPEAALVAFKFALEYNPFFKDARYNFELLSLKMAAQEPITSSSGTFTTPPPSSPFKGSVDSPEAIFGPLQRDIAGYVSHVYAYARWMLKLRKAFSSSERTLPSQPIDTITVNEARIIMEEMRQQDIQFLQQLKKSSRSANNEQSQKAW